MTRVLEGERWLADALGEDEGAPEVQRESKLPMQLLRECWEDSEERSVEPFLRVLQRPRASGGWLGWVRGLLGRPDSRKRIDRQRIGVMQLLLGETDPQLVALARTLSADRDEEDAVRAIASEGHPAVASTRIPATVALTSAARDDESTSAVPCTSSAMPSMMRGSSRSPDPRATKSAAVANPVTSSSPDWWLGLTNVASNVEPSRPSGRWCASATTRVGRPVTSRPATHVYPIPSGYLCTANASRNFCSS